MTSIPLDGQSPADPRPELAVVPPAATDVSPSADGTLFGLGQAQDRPAAPPPAASETKQTRRARKREEVSAHRKAARLQRLLGRRKVSGRASIRALVLEQQLHGALRGADTATHTESLVRSTGKAGGDAALDGTLGTLNKQAGQRDGLQAQQETKRIQAGSRGGDLVSHPDGGVRTVAQTQGDQDDQRQEIAGEEDQGSRKHRRLPRLLRLVPKLVGGFDAGLLIYFFAGVTNVDWTRPASASLLFAVMLAAAVTGISFGFFTLAGTLLNTHKTEDGTLGLDELDLLTKAVLALAGVGVVVLALLMFVRMRAEVLVSGGHGGAAAVIALTLAVVSVLANTAVVVVHALDGSEATTRLDGLGKAVRRPLREEHRLLEQAAAFDPAIAAADKKAQRTASLGITQAGRHAAAADQVVDAARAVHQGVGLLSEPDTDPNGAPGVLGYRTSQVHPKVDERPVRLALQHLAVPAAPPAEGGATTRTERPTQPGSPEAADVADAVQLTKDPGNAA
jgi:hypothetical protein